MPQKYFFFCIFGLLSYRYNIYQVRLEFRKLFDMLVHPNTHCTRRILFTSPPTLSDLTLWLILSIAPTMVPIVLTSLWKEFHSGNYKLLRFIPMVLLLHRVTAPCLYHTLLCNRRLVDGGHCPGYCHHIV